MCLTQTITYLCWGQSGQYYYPIEDPRNLSILDSVFSEAVILRTLKSANFSHFLFTRIARRVPWMNLLFLYWSYLTYWEGASFRNAKNCTKSTKYRIPSMAGRTRWTGSMRSKKICPKGRNDELDSKLLKTTFLQVLFLFLQQSSSTQDCYSIDFFSLLRGLAFWCDDSDALCVLIWAGDGSGV